VLATHDLDTLDVLADRCVVFSEDHRVAAQGPPDAIMADRDLLVASNLVHAHRHVHHAADEPHAHVHEGAHHVSDH
jgi:cobalt/nickel transport system ATP-binding protein